MPESSETTTSQQLPAVKAEYPPRIFNCRIKELRESHPDKITVFQLAAHIGVTPLTMARIEEGCDTRLSNAVAIAALFNVTVEDIWTKK